MKKNGFKSRIWNLIFHFLTNLVIVGIFWRSLFLQQLLPTPTLRPNPLKRHVPFAWSASANTWTPRAGLCPTRAGEALRGGLVHWALLERSKPVYERSELRRQAHALYGPWHWKTSPISLGIWAGWTRLLWSPDGPLCRNFLGRGPEASGNRTPSGRAKLFGRH